MTASSPKTRANWRNAASSSGKAVTHECAIVPDTGMPNLRPASTFDVDSQPAMNAARAASRPASGPWARREPNSTTGRPAAASTIRAARLATEVWKARLASRAVSTNCASGSGAVTRSSGSGGNTGVPSGTAHTSPVKRKCARYSSKNSGTTRRKAGRSRR